jgi:hypothetical protein
MHHFYRRHYRWARHLPRRKHLKGGWIHRVLGDRLFAPELWRPCPQTVARGLALGVFIGMTPTLGVQVFLAGIAACFARVNLVAAIVGVLFTNPLTAPVIYPLEYRLGIWISGQPDALEVADYTALLRNFAQYAKPLWVGSIITGTVLAVAVYGTTILLWKEAVRFIHSHQHRPSVPSGRFRAKARKPVDTGRS